MLSLGLKPNFKQPVGLTHSTHNRRNNSETWKLSLQPMPQLLSFQKSFKKKNPHLQVFVCRAQQKAVERERERGTQIEREFRKRL
jgi:hypothetical protein